MLILQVGMIGGRCVLWGETTPTATNGARRPSGKKAAVAPSPYDPGAERLIAAACEILGAAERDSLVAQHGLIWLPTGKTAPIPSSALLLPSSEPEPATRLAAWGVTGIALRWAQVAEALCACVGQDTLGNGALIGNTLLYWTTAMRFAGALVARQQFLPDLGKIAPGDEWEAFWHPLLTSAGDAYAQLAKAMPPACRALGADPAPPPDIPATQLLNEFLSALTDHFVRTAPDPNLVAFVPQAKSARKAAKPKAPAFDSLHDQWLYRLQADDRRMEGDEKELVEFAAQIRAWRRPLFLSLAAPFRLCFRLEEPLLEREDDTGEDASWYVRYLLQSVEDPSLLIPVENVWRGGDKINALLESQDFEPREFLLTALGQASKISAAIEESLKAAAPGGYALTTAQAQDFLLEKAWMLEQSGFVVLLPAWWTRKGTKNRLTAQANVKSPPMTSLAGLSLDAIVQFDWQAALGRVKLTLAELEALAKQKVSLVRLRGQWVQLDSREIEAALAFWKRRDAERMSVRDILKLALGAQEAPGGLAIDAVNATGWVGDLLAKMQGGAALEPIPVSEAFQGTLRPYQRRGYEWLHFLGQWGLGACLADDMGLGKTSQTLAFLQRTWEENGKRPALVICPTSVVGNWYREAQRFTPNLPVMVHHGSTRTKGEEFKAEAERNAIVLSSFALLHRDFERFKEVQWSGVVLDEAQNIKNPETKQSKAARGLTADWRIALTGTPVENHVGDLWSILEFLNPGFLGSSGEFKRNFYYPIQANRDPDASDRLKRLTRPFILRRVKTDKTIISDLPDKLEMKVYCSMTPEQVSLYEAVVKETLEEVTEAEGIQRRGKVLALLSKLKQVCNHPAQFLGDNSAIPGRSGKLARLTEMLEEALEVDDKALIFTQFTEMGEIIRQHLQETFGREVLFLHGGTPKSRRDRMVERFQNEGKALPIFLLSLKAGGVGLNLTAANHVFHFDRWWNPAVENQATDRAFRIGQTKNVQVHKFLCAGTLEEKIDEMIERKREVAAGVVGTGEEWLTELSTEELRDLFTLRRDALLGVG